MSTAALARRGSRQPVRRARRAAGRLWWRAGRPCRGSWDHRHDWQARTASRSSRPRGGVVLTHTLEADTQGLMTLLWPLYVRPLHDAGGFAMTCPTPRRIAT